MNQSEIQDSELDEIDSLQVFDERKVEKRRLRPLTSHLDFDVTHRPTSARDRVSKKRVITGFLFGLFLIVVGFAAELSHVDEDFFGILSDAGSETAEPGWLSAAWLFVGLGIFIILTQVMLLFYGRDFFIGHNFAAVVIQKPFEQSLRMTGALDDYIGVRYRTRIVRVLGLTSFTQHIIDLQHSNEAKSIPLYITKNGEGISKKWEELARAMNMPAIFNTADGIVEIAPEDIQKSLPEMIKTGKIKIDDSNLYKVPHSFRIVEDSAACRIDPLIRDSAFSKTSAFLCLVTFFCLAFIGFVFAMRAHDTAPVMMPLLAAGLLLFGLIPTALFFRRRRIIIGKNGIRIKSRWFLWPSVGIQIPPEKLEFVIVVPNSYDFKYSLVVGADGQTTHIGRGLPKEDLNWLENFINAQVRRFIVGKKG